MRLLDHPDIEQLENHYGPDNEIFGAEFRLHGSFSLTELMHFFEEELLACIQEDIADGSYQTAFILPDEIKHDADAASKLYERAAVSGVGQRNEEFFVDDRNRGNYFARLPHTHDFAACTSSLCVEEGARGTIFVADEQELVDLMRLNAAQVRDLLIDHQGNILDESADQNSRHLIERVTSHFSSLPDKHIERFNSFLDTVKMQQQGKMIGRTKPGRLHVFAGTVVHAADAQSVAGDPGELYVRHWRRKAK